MGTSEMLLAKEPDRPPTGRSGRVREIEAARKASRKCTVIGRIPCIGDV